MNTVKSLIEQGINRKFKESDNHYWMGYGSATLFLFPATNTLAINNTISQVVIPCNEVAMLYVTSNNITIELHSHARVTLFM